MARKLVTDMSKERFRAWQDLLRWDRTLSHEMGILAVRDEGTTFRPGVLRNDLPASRDPDYGAMQAYPDGLAFGYVYERSVHSVTDRDAKIAPGYYACLLVFENDVSLSSLRPRIDKLIAAQHKQAATLIAAPDVEPISGNTSQLAVASETPREVQPGAA